MASIEKQKRLYGDCYVIRTNFVNPITKETIRKGMTWRIPENMRCIDAHNEALRLALEFENNLKEQISCGFELTNYTIEEYSAVYLEFIKKNNSVTYFIRAEELLGYLNKKIGKIKICKLNPYLIQKYFDDVDSEKRIVEYIYPKKDFKDTLDSFYTYTILRRELKIQHYTLSKAYKGKNVSLKWANKLCEMTQIPFEKLFNRKTELFDYAYRTKHQRKIILRQLLAFAKRRRIIKENYATADFVFYSKNRQPVEIKVMNKNEVIKFFNIIINHNDLRIKVAMLLFLFTGFRRSEVAGLKWDDIDFDNRRISIKRIIISVHGYGTIEKEPKTLGSIRTITISEQLCKILKEYQKVSLIKKNKQKWLFIKKNGNVISSETFLIWLRKILKEYNFPNYTIHSLRHTNITLQLLNGVPLPIVSARAGHSTPSTTFNYYSHFLVGEDDVAVRTLDYFFEQNKNGK